MHVDSTVLTDLQRVLNAKQPIGAPDQDIGSIVLNVFSASQPVQIMSLPGSNITIPLPSPSDSSVVGRLYYVKALTLGGNTVTFTASGSGFDGGASAVLAADYEGFILFALGGTQNLWLKIAHFTV